MSKSTPDLTPNPANGKRAGGHIEWNGLEFNAGDPVPDALVAEYPMWLEDARLSDKEIEELTEAQAKSALRAYSRGAAGAEILAAIDQAGGEG